MHRIIQPLIQKCLSEEGSEDSTELKRLREYLKNAIDIYKSLKKAKSKLKHIETFQREVAVSKWSHQEPSSGSAAPSVAPLPSISAKDVVIEKVTPLREVAVASLAHGLERVLFNPGIHWLQDPRSGHYNFPKQVQTVMPKEDFNFQALPRFIRPSADSNLRELLKKTGKTFAGSTSR